MISVLRASLVSASGLEELPPLVQRVDNDGEKGGQGILDHLRTRRQTLTVTRYTPLARQQPVACAALHRRPTN
jgi:hypothetical protein